MEPGVSRPGRELVAGPRVRVECGTFGPGSAGRPEGTAGTLWECARPSRVAGPGLLCGHRAPLPGTGAAGSVGAKRTGRGGADGPRASGTPRGRLLCSVASAGPVALP